VQPDSPAAKAGLQAGDVILRYNGEPVAEANELPRLVAATKPGTQAKLEIWRERAAREVNVTIGELDADVAAGRSSAAAPKADRLGLSVHVLPAEQRRALGIKFGLVVETIDPAARAPQLNPGDVIVGINNTEFASLEQFNAIVAQQKPGTSVALLVRRGDAALYIPVKVQG
jgi:serine protease Do